MRHDALFSSPRLPENSVRAESRYGIRPAKSFRDPGGCCLRANGRVFRLVNDATLAELEGFLASPCGQVLIQERRLVGTRRMEEEEIELLQLEGVLPEEASDAGVFDHERIFFPSFPYEWAPAMLFSAGMLTLDLVKEIKADGFGLKDATPFNVLFEGPTPVFVDALSFERREPSDPIWKPYAQFVRMFLLPLLANRLWGTRLSDIFLSHRDGLEPEEVYEHCGWLQKSQPQVLSLVSIPTWLSRFGVPASRVNVAADSTDRLKPGLQTVANIPSDKARFVLDQLFRRLERALVKLQPKETKESAWSNYMQGHSYEQEAFAAKEAFVEAALAEFGPKRVLDIGANTGHFSLLAARQGATVVAIDSDAACVGALWREASRHALNVLPLVVDFARPSPAIGWRNSECPGFLERAAGEFDGVLMLAVLHHLVVTERIPLREILELAAQITTDFLVIEFVGPTDPMFQKLLRGRDGLFAGFDENVFEKTAREFFDIVRSLPLPKTDRVMYFLRKK